MFTIIAKTATGSTYTLSLNEVERTARHTRDAFTPPEACFNHARPMDLGTFEFLRTTDVPEHMGSMRGIGGTVLVCYGPDGSWLFRTSPLVSLTINGVEVPCYQTAITVV